MPRALRGATWIFLSLLVLAPGLSAEAQARSQSGADAAVEEYQIGRADFEAGRYRDAIEHLERAVTLDPTSPTLVYNVARVYELLGDYDNAIGSYRTYLTMLATTADDAAERSRVQLIIDRLEGAQELAAANAPPPPTDTSGEHLDRPVLAEESGVADTAFWATAGGAAVLLATGGVLGALALVNRNNADCTVGDQCTLPERDDYAATARSLALGADILLITGGVAAVTAVLLYALRTRMVETYPQYEGLTAFVGTDGKGAMAGLRGAF